MATLLATGVEVNVYAGGNLAAAEVLCLFEQILVALRSPPPVRALRRGSNPRAGPRPPSSPHAFAPRAPSGQVPEGARAVESCALLPCEWRVRALPARTAHDSNCAVQAYWQLGPNEERLSALMSLVEHIMYEPLFDALRTKQQLGYSARRRPPPPAPRAPRRSPRPLPTPAHHRTLRRGLHRTALAWQVYVSARNTNQMLGLLIGVVSATATPSEVEAAIAAFMAPFVASLEQMPAAQYARHVEACAANRLQDDHNLQEEATRYFSEVESGQLAFDRAEVEAAAIQRVSQPELARWARATLLPGGDGRRLSVHVYKSALTVAPTPDDAAPIDDPAAHRAGLDSYAPTRAPLPPVAGVV